MTLPLFDALVAALPSVRGRAVSLCWRTDDNDEHEATVAFDSDGAVTVASYEVTFRASVCPVCGQSQTPGTHSVERHVRKTHPDVVEGGDLYHDAGSCGPCDDLRIRLGGDLAREVAEQTRRMAESSKEILDRIEAVDAAVRPTIRRYAEDSVSLHERAVLAVDAASKHSGKAGAR